MKKVRTVLARLGNHTSLCGLLVHTEVMLSILDEMGTDFQVLPSSDRSSVASAVAQMSISDEAQTLEM